MKKPKKEKKPQSWNPKRKAKAKRRLDRAFSLIVLLRDKRTCRWCKRSTDETGKQLKIDNSHIIPREVLSLRWDERNGVGLCFRCHKSKRLNSWHGSPLVAIRWLRTEFGNEACDELIRIAEAPYDFTEAEYLAIDARLTQRLKELENDEHT